MKLVRETLPVSRIRPLAQAVVSMGFSLALAITQWPASSVAQSQGVSSQPASNDQTARAGETHTRLPNGHILVLGGPSATNVARLYESSKHQSTPLQGGLLYPRTGHSATLLPDGCVLILGGRNDAGLVTHVETFDPVTQQFQVIGDVGLLPRSGHAAVMLSDGQLLVVGGMGANGEPIITAEVWNPRTGWARAADRSVVLERVEPNLQLLPDGTVLVIGGRRVDGETIAGALRYRPEQSRFDELTLAQADALLLAAMSPGRLRITASVPPADDHDFDPNALLN